MFIKRQRYVYKHDSIASLIKFDCPLGMESMVLVNTVWATDEKHKCWAAIKIIGTVYKFNFCYFEF